MPTLTKQVKQEITWEAIASKIHSGKAAEVLSVEDIISITLKDETAMRIAVAGIDTYNENEVIFAFKDILPQEHRMNPRHTNAGGYDASEMASYLDNDVFALLPDDLQAVIKERRGHKLWLFSRYEVFGENLWYTSPENDKHIPYYQTAANRVKTRNGETDWWWLASPSSANTTNFALVNDYGYSNDYGASNSFGVAPGFCI